VALLAVSVLQCEIAPSSFSVRADKQRGSIWAWPGAALNTRQRIHMFKSKIKQPLAARPAAKQFTIRVAVLGTIFGVLLGMTNIYSALKSGWGFSVGLTAVFLANIIFNRIFCTGSRWFGVRLLNLSPLEACTLSTITQGAAFSATSCLGTANAAYMLITHQQMEWQKLIPWTFLTASFGVIAAVSMRKLLVLDFVDGQATANAVTCLYDNGAQSDVEKHQAKRQSFWLSVFMAMSVVVGLLKADLGKFKSIIVAFIQTHTGWTHFSLTFKDLYTWKKLSIAGVGLSKMPAFGYEPSVVLLGAGLMVNWRISLSLFLGSLITYMGIGPVVVNLGQVTPGHIIKEWTLWIGAALVLSNTLFALILPALVVASKIICRLVRCGWRCLRLAIRILGAVKNWNELRQLVEICSLLLCQALRSSGFRATHQIVVRWRELRSKLHFRSGKRGELQNVNAPSSNGAPTKLAFVLGIPLLLGLVVIYDTQFGVPPWKTLIAVGLSFFLARVCAESTGRTNITPIGMAGKVTQIIFGVFLSATVTQNLMLGALTAVIAACASDLLQDLKTGLLLGANPKTQILAQLYGVLVGSLGCTAAYYAMVPTMAALEHYPHPSATMWQAVCVVLSTKGLSMIPHDAQCGMIVATAVGIFIAIINRFGSNRVKAFCPNAIGLGLGFAIPFNAALNMALGGVLQLVWKGIHNKSYEGYNKFVGAGLVAGEGLVMSLVAVVTAVAAMIAHS
jgi:OPT family oligopeptide transporter